MKLAGKKMEKALMRKEKHRVLIFGEKTYGGQQLNIDLNFCDVELIPFPSGYEKLGRLSEYTLVILDYSVFHKDKLIYPEAQEIFEKQMLEALGWGTCFCILHYDDVVPRCYIDRGNVERMLEDDIKECCELQLGFRWLYRFDIRPIRSDISIIRSKTQINEFKRYLEHWGASKLYFRPYDEGAFSEIIFDSAEKTLKLIGQGWLEGLHRAQASSQPSPERSNGLLLGTF